MSQSTRPTRQQSRQRQRTSPPGQCQEIVEDLEFRLEVEDVDGGEGGGGGGGGSGEEELDLNALKEEVCLKLLVLGDLGVGKTTLIRRYTGDDEAEVNCDYKVSVETDFSVKKVELDGKSVSIQLWDIPGHERFGGMTRAVYKFAHGALIVFDLSRPETFESALSWLSDVTEKLFDERQQRESQQRQQVSSAKSQTSSRGGSGGGGGGGGGGGEGGGGGASALGGMSDEASGSDLMPVILLANKCDLPELKVPRNKYSTYVRENGLLAWYETSSHDPSCGVALAVRRLVEFVLETDPSLRIARDNAMIWKKQ